ncbi:MAG: HD domain-containing protein [Clostridiales bacterium]|nr:HD domain-containing protein [Clostridiales bacterium]
MAYSTFAAIDVGSNELTMKIYQVSKKDGIHELDCIRHTIELGSESYRYGKISHQTIHEVCQILNDFQKKMKEYKATEYTAYATSAIREASNNILLLDQIKLETGIKVKIVSNSEQRFLSCRALSLKEDSFARLIEKGAVIVDIGSGSIQLTLFDHSYLIATQNIRLGSIRIRDLLSSMEDQTEDFQGVIKEYIYNDIETFRHFYLENRKIDNIICIGERLHGLSYYLKPSEVKENDSFPESISQSRFEKIFQHISNAKQSELCEELGLSKEQVSLLLPTALIYRLVFKASNAKNMWFSGVTLCDGIVEEFAERKEKLLPKHRFTEDIVSASRNIALRYCCNTNHSKNVEYLALELFDSIRKYHGLGNRERLLLQIAVILHNCGEFVNMNAVADNSYHIVLSTEIIGLSHAEREIVANITRYDYASFPKYNHDIHGLSQETYIKLSKLIAIMSVANILDKSHRQKISDVSMILKDRLLTIRANTLEDITLEKGLLCKPAAFFENVFGIQLVLTKRREK